MEAGRELDALVAERLGAIKVIPYGTSEGDFFCHWGNTPDGGGISRPLCHYSTSIAAAWELVEKLKGDSCTIDISSATPGWICMIDVLHGHGAEVRADTAPLAICLAFLKATEENNG